MPKPAPKPKPTPGPTPTPPAGPIAAPLYGGGFILQDGGIVLQSTVQGT